MARDDRRATLPWVGVAPDAPYFILEDGRPFTPIGQNDAISWVEFEGLFRRRDLPRVERHLLHLREHGITVLRLMVEYAQVRHRYFERPAGRPVPAMVQLWDDLFAMCERVGLRILLTPVDTFWMWLHWRHHPWNRVHGGPLAHPSEMLLCRDTRAAIKARLEFMVRRWGGSGALFAWDLWNEIHPAQGGDSVECWPEFIADLSHHVRRLERDLHGRARPQTVSLFGPELWWRPELPMAEPIFRHPDLDFASIHIYREGSIDDPRDTVAPAVAMGRIVRDCLDQTPAGRPFLDTEHGPIHSFKDKKRTLPELFDDEYFRHMSWAHLASGAAGGGMRWPNRKPHTLTLGMRRAQRAMAGFLPLVDWTRFRRRNLNGSVRATHFHRFGCGDAEQAVVWLLRRRALAADGRVRRLLPRPPGRPRRARRALGRDPDTVGHDRPAQCRPVDERLHGPRDARRTVDAGARAQEVAAGRRMRLWEYHGGDPSAAGWLIALSYFGASLLCLGAARAASAAVPAGGPRAESRFWLTLAACALALGFNKQLDLQMYLAQFGKEMAQQEGWYEQRRAVQAVFILIVCAGATAAIALLWRWTLSASAWAWVGLLGCGFSAAFVLSRAASFHHMDRWIHEYVAGATVNHIAELSGIALIAVGAVGRCWSAYLLTRN